MASREIVDRVDATGQPQCAESSTESARPSELSNSSFA